MPPVTTPHGASLRRITTAFALLSIGVVSASLRGHADNMGTAADAIQGQRFDGRELAANNDAFSGRSTLSTSGGSAVVTMQTATSELNEPGQSYGTPAEFHTRWYSFTPGTSGFLLLSVANVDGSYFPWIQFHVYRHSSVLSQLQLLADSAYCNGAQCVVLPFASGDKFAIQLYYIGGTTDYNGAPGANTLFSWSVGCTYNCNCW